MCMMSCRPVEMELLVDPELDDDRPVFLDDSEAVGDVLLVRSLSSQIWTRTLLPV
jgi:hypothetical protein